MPLNDDSMASSTMSLEQQLSDLLESDEFSVGSYLNLALGDVGKDGSSEEDDERRMAELALQLQFQTQSCHDEIGRIGAELRAVLPRCAGDIERLGVGVQGMKEDVSGLFMEQKTSSQSNKDENKLETLETLSTLHALRSNLSTTKSILAAASSWDSTMAHIPSLLSGNHDSNTKQEASLHEAVKALSQLQLGANALRGMPGLQEREDAINSIKSDILKLLKPQLLHALQRMDTRLGPLQQCVSMYNSLGHVQDVLMEEYVKQRPTQILKLWFQFSASAASSSTNIHQQQQYEEQQEEEDNLEFYNADNPSQKPASSTSNMESKNTSTHINVIDTATAFVQWLPTWYESVLALLIEERRRAQTVFGPDLAPEIIVKVLSECFRPIVSSFKSRLNSIFSPSAFENTIPSNVNNCGSFESICTLYESTLQFLSEAYEQMTTIDEEEIQTKSSAFPKRSKTPLQLYQFIRKLFSRIASPFAPYQLYFASLEDHYSGFAARMVAKDIANAVRVTKSSQQSNNVSILQESVEKLQGLAPYMFPLAQSALARFELLNCGYNAQSAMHTVDQLLSRHVGELSIAVDTLAANMDTSKLESSSWDLEPHLSCALEVLKMTGSFAHSLQDLQEKTRERLLIVFERSHKPKKSEDTSVPDSISAVEVEDMLAKYVCCNKGGGDPDENLASSLLTLKKFANAKERVSLFPDTLEAISRLTKTCHTFIFDVCFVVPKQYLLKLSTMSIWKENNVENENEWEGGETSYGTLPQSYITHVGEHMLALVQALEPFASDPEALRLTALVMDGLQEAAVQPWREFISATHCAQIDPLDKEITSILMNKSSLEDIVDISSGFDDPNMSEDYSPEEEGGSAEFCNKWLDVVCCAVTGRLLERILRIPRLASAKACEQLSADVDYLVNVFSALGVKGHPHPLLKYFAKLCMMDAEEWKLAIESRTSKPHEVSFVVKAAEVRLAAIRGISIS